MSSLNESVAVQVEVKQAVAALVKADPLLRGSQALAAIRETPSILVIQSDEDVARVGDLRLPLRKAVRHVEDALTDLFRPREMFKKMLREHFKTTYVEPMEQTIKQIDSALVAWDMEKRRRAEAERLAAEAAAREAAIAAAAEARRIADEIAAERAKAEEAKRRGDEVAETFATAAADALGEEADEPPPGVAQVIVAPVDRGPQRGETATTFLRRTLECALEDQAAAMRAWPEAFTFDPRAACKAFDASGEKRPADGDFVLAGGIRFTVVVSIGGRGR